MLPLSALCGDAKDKHTLIHLRSLITVILPKFCHCFENVA